MGMVDIDKITEGNMKKGIDYFGLDVHNNVKIQLLEAQFGLTGFAVIIKLMQRIYGEEGYYCDWSEENALLFSKNNYIKIAALNTIIDEAIKRGLFCKDKYEKYKILTSRDIQERFLLSKKVNMESDYLLIEIPPDMTRVDLCPATWWRWRSTPCSINFRRSRSWT
jgi:hypothetical protein